ncbi:MAG: DUF3410 domain-containing protein, partial [Gammaproteobacteria bacterium]
PHIAGYTVQAKSRAVLMLYQAAQLALQLQGQLLLSNPLAATTELKLTSATLTWQDTVLMIYDPGRDTEITRSTLLKCGNPPGKCFDKLRQHHQPRHEFSNVHLMLEGTKKQSHNSDILEQLGFVLSETSSLRTQRSNPETNV